MADSIPPRWNLVLRNWPRSRIFVRVRVDWCLFESWLTGRGSNRSPSPGEPTHARSILLLFNLLDDRRTLHRNRVTEALEFEDFGIIIVEQKGEATSIKTEDACSWMENFCGTKEERIFYYSVWYFWFFRAECGLDERSCHEGVRWIRGLESSPPQLGNKFYTRVLSKYFKNFIYHSFQTSGLTNSLLFSEWKIKWWSGENRKARKEKWSHYLTRMEIFEFNSDKNFLSAIHRSISKHIKYRFYELEFYNPPMIFYPSYDRFLFYYVFIFDSSI